MATPQHKTNPFVPKPKIKEEPVHEELTNHTVTHEEHTKPYKLVYPVPVPNYNTLYDGLRSKQGWRYISEASAQGTVTTVAGSSVLVPVTMTQTPNWRLEQWPGGTQLFLVVRMFSVGPQTASFATQGEISVLYLDWSANVTPLGIIPNNGFYTNGFDTILPAAITDPGLAALGQLSFTLNAGATVGNYSWQLGFSAAYLLPALHGYSLEKWDDHIHNLD